MTALIHSLNVQQRATPGNVVQKQARTKKQHQETMEGNHIENIGRRDMVGIEVLSPYGVRRDVGNLSPT